MHIPPLRQGRKMQREAVVHAGWWVHPNETPDHILQNQKDRRVAFELELARELAHARQH